MTEMSSQSSNPASPLNQPPIQLQHEGSSLEHLPSATHTTTSYLEPFNSQHEHLSTGAMDVGTPLLTTSQRESVQVNTTPGGIQEEHKQNPTASFLTIPADSPLIRRHWISESPESDNDDPMIVLDKFCKILNELNSARINVEKCFQEKMREREDSLRKLALSERELEATREENKELKLCEQEVYEYNQKCARVEEVEKEMREYYSDKLQTVENELQASTEQLKYLKGKLQVVTEEKGQAEKEHKCQVDHLEQKHQQEKADLRYTVQIQSRHCQELEKELKTKDSKFRELESRFKEKQADVKQLRETLQSKEKDLKDLETELETRRAEIQVKVVTEERKTVGEQLQRCQEIQELVKRLPNVTTRDDLEKITKQINNDITKMKATTTRRKSISWR